MPLSRKLRPITLGSAAKRSRQRRSESTTTRSRPGRSSAAVKTRPSSGLTPNASKYPAETRSPTILSGGPSPVRLKLDVQEAARREKERASRKPRKLAAESERSSPCWVRQSWTIRSGWGNGSGFSTTAWSRLKIAVVAPTPRASVATAISAKTGALRSWRRAKTASCRSSERTSVHRRPRTVWRPISRQRRRTSSISPKRRRASSRAADGSSPSSSIRSRVRISRWNAISSSTSCSTVPPRRWRRKARRQLAMSSPSQAVAAWSTLPTRPAPRGEAEGRAPARHVTPLPSGRGVEPPAPGLGIALPGLRLGLELAAPFVGEAVDLRPPVVLGNPPLRLDPPPLLHPVEGRIERPLLDPQRVGGLAGDPPHHRIAVERPPRQGLEDQDVERPLQQVHLGHRALP